MILFNNFINRREFVQRITLLFGLIASTGIFGRSFKMGVLKGYLVDDFNRPDSLYHGDSWESLNPGYWQIKGNSLQRRLKNFGDKARATGFPFHYETEQLKGKKVGVMDTSYDPSLPLGILWSRDWQLSSEYELAISGKINEISSPQESPAKIKWKKFKKGNGVLGIAIGGKSLYEGFHPHDNSCCLVLIKDNNRFCITKHKNWELLGLDKDCDIPIEPIKSGDQIEMNCFVKPHSDRKLIKAELKVNSKIYRIEHEVENETDISGYFGIAARGELDFSIDKLQIETSEKPLRNRLNECLICYPLGDSLQEKNGKWSVRFVGIFRNKGNVAEIRVSDSSDPKKGWEKVKIAGTGFIISNEFRRNTAIIDVELPFDPSDQTMYYTIFKDGKNVTEDTRIGSDSVGPGTGFIGQTPETGQYVGRLPQLKAPYRICGLSCHAINGQRPDLPDAEMWQANYVHDQPTPKAYQHLEDYNFQIMLWEDDVWYMELLLYPPSTDDAYKIVTTTLCGPTTRWQMMRHWNVLNPGDHDHGMDDVKGPEQIAIRNLNNLGQDPDYMIRNFQIVSHLMTGKVNPSGTDNPKRWRKWKMPDKDFTLIILDSRLWRSSQDTNIWDDEGWGDVQNIYDRTDPTRSLLGEEQFAWLYNNIKIDSAPIICLTGINGLHSIWKGIFWGEGEARLGEFNSRDRIAADYASWVKAGVDRVIELIGGRDGVISVYGDVHNGSIIKNVKHGIYECSFGPIGRSDGRKLISGFGKNMKDFDQRDVEAIALYTENYENVNLDDREGPFYWNFLEMIFDPINVESSIQLTIRNLIDSPQEMPRGGNVVQDMTKNTGRKISSSLPSMVTLPDADIVILSSEGHPIRGCRSDSKGLISLHGLIDIPAGSLVSLMVTNEEDIASHRVLTIEPRNNQ